jgi:hypothetical protein
VTFHDSWRCYPRWPGIPERNFIQSAWILHGT